jgi:hypothetical protein
VPEDDPKVKPDHDIRFSYYQLPGSGKSLADETKSGKSLADEAKKERTQARRKKQAAIEHRAGRGALWVMAPPLGLWRSWKHGQKKRDAKLAQDIAEEISKRQK